MDFVYDLTIPAKTPANAPAELEIDVGAGVIHLVEIEEAPGCKGLVYAAVRQGLHQVWPTNPGGAYRSDGRVYSSPEHYPINPGDPLLVIQGWSLDETWPHTVQFRFSVLPEEVLEAEQRSEGLLRKLLKAFGV